MNKFIITISIVLLALPGAALAKALPAGFPKDMIWFSKDPFFVGERIEVNTFIFNSSPYRMKGFVTLKDGTTTIDKRSFVLDASGSSEVVSFPWIVTPGVHSFFALIEQGEFVSASSSGTASVSETSKVKRTPSYDENHNGIADESEPPVVAPRVAATTSASSTLPDNPAKAAEAVITEEAPKPIADLTLPILGGVERFRIDEAKRAARNVDGAVSNIASRRGTTSAALYRDIGDTRKSAWNVFTRGIADGYIVHTPFDYVKLFFALLAHAITTHPYVFYVLLALVLYKIARIVIGIFF